MVFRQVFEKLIVVLLVAVVLFAGYNVLSSFNQGANPSPTPTVQISTITPTPTEEAPAKLQLIVLTVPECRDCFDVDAFVFALQQAGAELDVQKSAYNTTEGAGLIAKYGVEKVPTIIFSGEISKIPQLEAILQQAADEVQGKMVLRDVAPPYLDLQTKEIVGRVSFTYVSDQSCFECRKATVPIGSVAVNASLLAETMLEASVGVAEDLEFDANSSEGKALISKYNLTRLPAIIISDDIEVYEQFATEFKKIGTVESDGNYVLRDLNPPFLNLSSKKVEGKLTMVYIKAGASCEPQCYDYTVHTKALGSLGVNADTSLYYDYDTFVGKNYTGGHNITKVPTVLVSPEVKMYPAFMRVYEQIGDFDSEGWFVFRNFDVLDGGTYFDLELNKTVELPSATG